MQALELFDLEGKTALVTGCDTGRGQAMAIALAGIACIGLCERNGVVCGRRMDGPVDF